MFANRWEEEAAIALIKEKKLKAAAKVVEHTKKRGAELMKKYLEAVPKAMKRVADLKAVLLHHGVDRSHWKNKKLAELQQLVVSDCWPAGHVVVASDQTTTAANALMQINQEPPPPPPFPNRRVVVCWLCLLPLRATKSRKDQHSWTPSN